MNGLWKGRPQGATTRQQQPLVDGEEFDEGGQVQAVFRGEFGEGRRQQFRLRLTTDSQSQAAAVENPSTQPPPGKEGQIPEGDAEAVFVGDGFLQVGGSLKTVATATHRAEVGEHGFGSPSVNARQTQ